MKQMNPGNKGFTLGELVVVFAIVIVVGLLMLPLIKYTGARTDNIICASNLQKLGRAMYIYAMEHEGRFPPTLKNLYDEHYLADTKAMDCPANKSTGTPESPDYIYTAGLSVKDPSSEPLVRDKAKNHPRGGKNVLYVSGVIAREE